MSLNDAKIGRYALIKLIGHGGMADVWVGKAFGGSGFEKVVAIKILTADNVDKEEYHRALTDEAHVLVNLQHANIVDVYDLNFEAENPYMVMEYVPGIELRELLKQLRQRGSSLPLPIAAYVSLEISKALSHAHECCDLETGKPLQIVHRDVSPSNILISNQGQVKLTDFGIAKSALQSTATQIGQIKGKFRYMSPEQAEGGVLDYRSDLFSLGLVLYESLFGVPAYDDPSDARLLQMARTGAVSYPSDTDPQLRKLFGKLLARHPSNRYSDLSTFRKELGEYLIAHGGIGEQETFRNYLDKLDLPGIQRAVTSRQEAEDWNPIPSSQILDQTGKISTFVEIKKPLLRRRSFQAGLIGAFLLAGLAVLAIKKAEPVGEKPEGPTGSVRIESEPRHAIVQVKYGDVSVSHPAPVSLPDVPLSTPIKIDVSKKGFRSETRTIELTSSKPDEGVKFSLEEIKEIKVTFSAEPFAEVSIPGQLSNIETPATKVFTAGDYVVTFVHPPSGRKATTTLKATKGGVASCTAQMRIGEPAATPTASCRML